MTTNEQEVKISDTQISFNKLHAIDGPPGQAAFGRPMVNAVGK
jgi:hypothetical protein